MTDRDLLAACAARAVCAAGAGLPDGIDIPHPEASAVAAEWREACADMEPPGDPEEFIEVARAHAAWQAAEALAAATSPALPSADVARGREAARAAMAHAAEAAAWEAALADEADPWVAVLDRLDSLGCDRAEYRQWLAALDLVRVAVHDAASGDAEDARADRARWWGGVRAASARAGERLAAGRAAPGAIHRVWDVAAAALERLGTFDPEALRLDGPATTQLPAIALAAHAAGEIARLAEEIAQAADAALA